MKRSYPQQQQQQQQLKNTTAYAKYLESIFSSA